MVKVSIYLFIGLFFKMGIAQTNKTLRFSLVINQKKLELNKTYLLLKDSITPRKLIFYISNIECLKNSKVIFKPKENYFLMDLENENLSKINLETKASFDSIRFNVGIDSLANASGAMNGVLDPINGMYWAWQSGYINFKFEGNSKNRSFQFHIGGYLSPYKTIKTLTFAVPKNKDVIDLLIDLDKFFKYVNLKELNNIMSPGEKAVELSDHYKDFILTKK